MPTEILLAILLGSAAVAAAVLLARRLWLKRRAEAWAQTAGQLGLAPSAAPAIPREAAELATFRRGRKQRLRAGAEGSSWGGDVLLADYEYTTGYGRNRRVHRQTVCVLRDAKLDLPHFVMHPERALIDRIGAWFGATDFDFDDDPEFSRAFVLSGDDEAAVRALFDPSVRTQLMQLGERRLFLEGSGHALVLHRGRLVPPAAAGGLLEQAVQVAALLRD